MKKVLPTIIVIVLGLSVQPTMAYIDPGSGSTIMTAIIGVFVAMGLAIKTYWYKIKSLFTGKKSNQQPASDSTPKEEP